jgi:hypothetical protein
MRNAFTTGIHISPLAVRTAAGLLGAATVGVVALQLPELVRYIKAEMM